MCAPKHKVICPFYLTFIVITTLTIETQAGFVVSRDGDTCIAPEHGNHYVEGSMEVSRDVIVQKNLAVGNEMDILAYIRSLEQRISVLEKKGYVAGGGGCNNNCDNGYLWGKASCNGKELVCPVGTTARVTSVYNGLCYCIGD